jgi:hypothetical protein
LNLEPRHLASQRLAFTRSSKAVFVAYSFLLLLAKKQRIFKKVEGEICWSRMLENVLFLLASAYYATNKQGVVVL